MFRKILPQDTEQLRSLKNFETFLFKNSNEMVIQYGNKCLALLRFNFKAPANIFVAITCQGVIVNS